MPRRLWVRGAGGAGGEFVAHELVNNFYDGKDTKDLSESEKQNISNWSQVVSGVTVGVASGGNIGDAGAAISASKNAVENNLLSNKQGVDKLDKESKELYKKIQDVVGYDEIDQLQKQYINCQSDECRTTAYKDYYQKEQEVGQKLVDLYKSGQLTKADSEQLVTWYNDSMLEGVEQAKADSGSNRNLWDIYDASSMDMTPASLIGKPYLAEIRGLILLEQWKSEGLSESQIQEKFLKDGVLGAFGSAPDVNIIAYKICNEGLSLDDGLALASASVFGKVINDASQGKWIAGKRTTGKRTTGKRTTGNVVKADATTHADATKYFGQDRQYWSSDPIQFSGNKVYQRNDLFDPKYIDPKSGKTNLQLMDKE